MVTQCAAPFITIDSPREHQMCASILRYSKHRRIIRIKQRVNDVNKFGFQTYGYSEV